MDIATVLFWVIYLLLGAHSLYFYIKRATLRHDIELSLGDILALIMVFSCPIVGHLATLITYPDPDKSTMVLFKKRKK